MTDQQREHSRQRLENGTVGKPFYLGEEGESFFMRTSGKGDFKVVNLISRKTFDLVDVFFSSEEEARLFATRRNLKIVDYTDNTCSATSNRERS